MTDLYLYVDNEDSTGSWNTTGTAPYISTQNQPTDYISDTGRNTDSGTYSFPASGHSSETINSVTLYIYAYGSSTSDFEAILSSSATGLGPPAGSWQWVSIDVSSILTTWAQIDAATVYFDRPNTTNDAGVDCCYLLVDYQGTTPANDNQNAYLTGNIADSDNQNAFTQGGLETSDTQSAYLAGGISASDNQTVYTSGIDTDSDNQPAYLEGSTDTSDTQHAYLSGHITTNSSQNAYLSGVIAASSSKHAYTDGFGGGTDPSVSWLWIMVPSGITTTSQHAYLAGGILTDSSLNAYMAGSSDTSDSTHAYTSGKSTSSDNQSAYTEGSLGASSSQHAYLAGTSTAEDSTSAYAHGSADASDSSHAYTSGILGASSSQHAYLEGAGAFSSLHAYLAGTSTGESSQAAYTYGIVLSSQPAYTEGWAPSASDSQHAYMEGYELTASDSQSAYMNASLHGTVDVQISADIDDCYQWFSYVNQYWTRYIDRTYVQSNGQINSPYLAAWRFLGIDIPDQTTYSVTITKAYMELYVYTPSYDDPHFNIYAQDNIAPTAPETGPMLDGRPMTDAYTSWDASGVYGLFGGYPNLWIPTPDISAPIQEVIDRPGWTPGFNICIMSYQHETNADFRSYDYAYNSAYAAKLHIEFVVGENNTQPAYLAGSNSTASSQSAYMDCAEVDSQPAYTAGIDTDANSQSAWTAGGIVSSDSTNAYTQGTGNISWQNAYIHGEDTTSDNQSAYTVGGIASSQHAFVMGLTVGPSQHAYTIGTGVGSDTQSGYTSGTDTGDDSQHAYMSGVILYKSVQHAFCNSGQLSTTSKQSAYISADIKSTQHVYLEGLSTVNDYVIISTLTHGTSLKFDVLAEGYAGTILETGRMIHKTIPGGIDITSGTLHRKWNPIIRVKYTESRPGYGTVPDLENFYLSDEAVLWQDHYGNEYKVHIYGDLQKSLRGLAIEGSGSIFTVQVELLEDLN